MEKLRIQGGYPLSGELTVHGAKNSSLPLLAAAMLSGEEVILHNCPSLSDVTAACSILRSLGCRVRREKDTVVVDSSSVTGWEIPEDLMAEMRSSIVFLGAILTRMGKAKMSFPGGCELGPRPIDLHLSALQQMGMEMDDRYGILDCLVNHRLSGAKISLSFPSVGATENILLAACMAEGETVITNAASEPEVVDLANFLNQCGARISGAGKQQIVVEGVERLHGTEYTVIPDRIVAATYLCCGLVSGGEILLRRVRPDHLESILPVLEQTGCRLLVEKDMIYLKSSGRPKALGTIRTMPYPGFPTDAQPLLMAVSAVADGTSVFVENIFENRFKHASELAKMGAKIKVEGKVAVVEGVPTLSGAPVRATDLRCGAALLIAGLSASGTTILSDTHHIDRGYQKIEEDLRQLGASVWRIYPV